MSGVKVQIFGETYTITTDLDDAYVQRMAAYVDQKINAIARMAPFMDRQKWAVLAALTISDELHRLKDEQIDKEDALKVHAEKCLELLDRALQNGQE